MYRMKLLVFGVFVLTSCAEDRDLSKEEDLELERQLKLLNKPPVKTIKTEYGDVYDCIDFYKQPAFDHPLLKNHDFHFDMKPNKVNKPKKIKNEETQKRRRDNKTKSVSLKGVGCPRGTVPIKRTTKEDLIRLKAFNEIFDSTIHPQTESEPGLHFAGSRVRPSFVKKELGGADAHFTLYETPNVGHNQFSSGLTKVTNGTDFIKAGWTVNPPLYGDNRCRFFAYLHTRDQHCFNTHCPGFVLVTTEFPLGYVFPEVSKAGDHLVEARFFIFRDPINGLWWLNLGDNETDIGFWPSRIFTGLTHNAEDIFWGGELYTLPGLKSCPMGNGRDIVYNNQTYYAYARDISIIDPDTRYVISVNSESVSDIDLGFVRQNYWSIGSEYWGRTVMFSGSGGHIYGKII